MFSKDFPDKLRSMILPSQVVGKRVKLKQNGREYTGLCPFHNEKTPSFSVNDQKGFYHCFGCGAHGDIITFKMETEGLDFKTAVETLANDFSIEIPRIKIDEKQVNKLDRAYLLLAEIMNFFEANLYKEENSKARNYLKKRGLNSIIAKKFHLGFAPDSYDSLNQFLLKKGFSEGELLQSGVIAKNDKGKIYDKMRDRVIFPIFDKKNRAVAFGGRVLGDALPKYLNSAETEIFKKNQTLYNISNARKSIFDEGFAIVVEGYMDVIALSKAGIENVVAGLGTALSANHLNELFYISDKIVLCLDGDAAGIKAAQRASEIALPLVNSKKNLHFCFLPNQMDPDDFVKNYGKDEFLSLINASSPMSQALLDFAISEVGANKDKKISAENKAKIELILNEKIKLIKDSALKKYFGNFLRESLFYMGSNKKRAEVSIAKKYLKPQENTADNYAKMALAFLIKFPQLADYKDNDFDFREIRFFSEKITILKDEILENLEKNGELQFAEINEDFVSELKEVKNLLASIEDNGLELATLKFRLFLLKDLLEKIKYQYKEFYSEITEISTSANDVDDEKIQEIFNYRTSIEKAILNLENQLIN